MKGRRRPNGYNAMKFFKETAKGKDITMPVDPAGGIANLGIKLTASLEDISNTAAFQTVPTKSAIKTLFGRYCITGVKYTFIPRYTSSDTTGRASDRVLYAINRDPQSPAPGSEEAVLRQNDCKFTNTSRKFTIYVKHPEPCVYSTASTADRTPQQGPVPANTNQVVASPSTRKWTWLPTKVIGNELEQVPQAPDHVGADVFITCNNKTLTDPYVVYTMYKTVYFAFKEQD